MKLQQDGLEPRLVRGRNKLVTLHQRSTSTSIEC